MAKKNPIAAAAKKMAAAPVSNSTVEVKAAETKTVKAEAPKAEAKKAEEPKKETAKKAPAKRTTAKDIKTSVVVQFAGKEVTEKDLIAAVKKAYTKKGNKVGDIKTIPNVRTYVAIDGGMYENPRYALYQSDYTCLIANKANEPADITATIACKCCESGDLIQENIQLPEMRRDDLLAVLTTGAYNFTMASNYNRLCRPALVMVRNGKARLAVRRQTFADLVDCDL